MDSFLLGHFSLNEANGVAILLSPTLKTEKCKQCDKQETGKKMATDV